MLASVIRSVVSRSVIATRSLNRINITNRTVYIKSQPITSYHQFNQLKYHKQLIIPTIRQFSTNNNIDQWKQKLYETKNNVQHQLTEKSKLIYAQYRNVNDILNQNKRYISIKKNEIIQKYPEWKELYDKFMIEYNRQYLESIKEDEEIKKIDHVDYIDYYIRDIKVRTVCPNKYDYYYNVDGTIDYSRSQQYDSHGRNVKLDEGDIMVYEKCWDKNEFKYIIKFHVSADAQRIPFMTRTNIGRVECATVVEIIGPAIVNHAVHGNPVALANSKQYKTTVVSIGGEANPEPFTYTVGDKIRCKYFMDNNYKNTGVSNSEYGIHGINVSKYEDFYSD